jgi:peptide/nickel transport system substrate-binding protein
MFEFKLVLNLVDTIRCPSKTDPKMRRKQVRSLAPLFLVVLCIFFFGCGQPAQNNNSSPSNTSSQFEHTVGTRGGTITYRMNPAPKTFNYLLVDSPPSVIVDFYLLGGHLIDFDGVTQRYVPGLAESWKQADDARTLDMTLRENLKFSDNYALTADDVAFTFKAVYDERTKAPVYSDALMIGGKKIEVTAVDPRHLRFVFPDPISSPESILSNLAVLPRHALEQQFNAGTISNAWGLDANPQAIVTSGPFTVDSSTPGERIVLKRNPNFWKKDEKGNQLPYLDSIVIVIVPDMNNAVGQLQQGGIDIIDQIRPNDYATLRKGNERVKAFDLGPGLLTDHIIFNLNEDPKTGKSAVDPTKAAWFNDVKFRKAVSYGIDRDSIAASTLQGLATPLYGIFSPGNKLWAAADITETEFDLDKSRALLKEAGFQVRGSNDAPELYDQKANRVEFTLIVQAENALRNAMATVIQNDLAKLGIKMNVTPIETSQINDRVQRGADYDAALLGTSTTQPDPSSYSTFFRSESVNHQWHPKQEKPATDWEARLDELEAAQERETNEDRRRSIVHDMQAIVAEQLPIVPIVARHTLTAANMRIGNYRPSALLPYSLWNVEELFVKSGQ